MAHKNIFLKIKTRSEHKPENQKEAKRRERRKEDEGEGGSGGLSEALDISPADVEQWRPALLLITASDYPPPFCI